jgi:hypothetical protein
VDEPYWSHFGRDYTYGLVVGGRLAGVLYWLDAELLDANAERDLAVTDPGWFWVSAEDPEHHHRVAQGLELAGDLSEDALAQTVEDALVAVFREVLEEGGRRRRRRRSRRG